jgi:hypothetical protein
MYVCVCARARACVHTLTHTHKHTHSLTHVHGVCVRQVSVCARDFILRKRAWRHGASSPYVCVCVCVCVCVHIYIVRYIHRQIDTEIDRNRHIDIRSGPRNVGPHESNQHNTDTALVSVSMF